jgi:hypothetical protein
MSEEDFGEPAGGQGELDLGRVPVGRARIYPLPENAQESTEHAPGCGLNTSEPLASFDPATSSWRTSQVSLLTLTWDEYSETWPRAGTMRNGTVYQQVPLAPLTGETECGSWPTPLAQDAFSGDSPAERLRDGPHMLSVIKMHTGIPQTKRLHLHPWWMEYLMGYPTRWTETIASATPSSRKLRKRSGA